MSNKSTTITATGATASLTKQRNENIVLISVGGDNTGLAFTVEASADGTSWDQVAVVSTKTGLLIAGGTTITPGTDADMSWVFPMAALYVLVRLNVSVLTTGEPTLLMQSSVEINGTLFSSIAGAAGSFTNLTASGTLGVTGLATFTGGTQVPDNATMAIGTGAGASGDIAFSWDATRMNVTQATVNSEIRWGVDGAGIDQMWYGDTASAFMNWDQSADSLVFSGGAGIKGMKVNQTGAVAITTTRAMTLADSGGIFTVAQSSAYDIDLPSPTTGPGCTYFFSLTAPGAFNVTITVAGAAATFVGSIISEGQIVVATGSTLTFASGVALLGDSVMVRSIATNLYHVVATASALNGITIS